MKYLFEIDDKSKTGKYLLPLLRELSKSNQGIDYLSSEEEEDKELVLLMKQAAKSGLADKKKVLSKLGIK